MDLFIPLEKNNFLKYELEKFITNTENILSLSGLFESQKVHCVSYIAEKLDKKLLYVVSNEMEAKKVYEDFQLFFDRVIYMPPRDIMLHDVKAKNFDNLYDRIKNIGKILKNEYEVIVITVDTAIQPYMDKRKFLHFCLEIDYEKEIDTEEISGKLHQMGYERVNTVEGKGQFAVRGGIIDIFPVNCNEPSRIELFGDEVDSIRTFDLISQRSKDSIKSLLIFPAREIVFEKNEIEQISKKIIERANEHINLIKERENIIGDDYTDKFFENINNDLQKLENIHNFLGIDKYISFFKDRLVSFGEYFEDEDIIICFDDFKKLNKKIEFFKSDYKELVRFLLEKGKILPQAFDLYDNKNLDDIFLNKKKLFIGSFQDRIEIDSLNIINVDIRGKEVLFSGNFSLMLDEIRKFKRENYLVVVLSGPKGRGVRLKEILQDEGIEAVYIEDEYKNAIIPGQVVIVPGSLHSGFLYNTLKYAVISDSEFSVKTKRKIRTKKKREGRKIESFTDLNIGDYVVHDIHGIGKYVGLEQLVVENVKKDYIKILYSNGDFLYVPTNQLDLIQKFIGSGDREPKLSKLGGKDWTRTKNRVKESLKEIAEELLKLYAERLKVKGIKFNEDTPWQKQFEDEFPFEETEDQLICIDEIKRDMESEKPMDRLLCGDVGYGKTEVALRAMFKAVMSGKQVAYLVPTTILAQQHYNNFVDRLKDFPVKVEVLSRFVSKSEQKRIIKEAEKGKVDILIGTHRLIQKDIIFKDLGLLVIDEEHRFGVAHKEKLKALWPDIDVLVLSATPIPRTLHMSLSGIRDISIIEEPPQERIPVQTYVIEYDEEIVKDAVEREIGRGGQVFYLYNNVKNIEDKAENINKLVRSANVCWAHGQMEEDELEDIIKKFIDGEFNVLVCTTIIESGIDMPNVNTIIIEDGDRLGLSQLYQLRGRVGRSNRQAYAYITYRRNKILSEIAEKRLRAIMEFTEFGSGFKIAMRDLEIRGAGNILGAQQHGQMEAVGYEMYIRLLDEAVNELKGEEVKMPKFTDITIDLKIDAYIDSKYIPSEIDRLEMYKKIASITDEQDRIDVEDELIDRYGDFPPEVKNLIDVAMIKILAVKCGFQSIVEKNGSVVFGFYLNKPFEFNIIGKIAEKYRGQIMFSAGVNPHILFKYKNNVVEEIKNILNEIVLCLDEQNKV